MERGLLPQGQAVALVKVMPRQISALGVHILEGCAIGSFLLGVILQANTFYSFISLLIVCASC